MAKVTNYFLVTQAELRELKSKCRISRNGKAAIRLQWGHQERRFTRTPPNCDMTMRGIAYAREICLTIDRQIRIGAYSEEWYEREINKNRATKLDLFTVGNVFKTFESKWLKQRARATSTDRQKNRSLGTHGDIFNRLVKKSKITLSSKFDEVAIGKMMAVYDEGSYGLFSARQTLSTICKVLKIDYTFERIGIRPKPRERIIPTDTEIVEMWNLFSTFSVNQQNNLWREYQWLFGLQATYGLRQQELWAIDWEYALNPINNGWIKLDQTLTDGLKTGDRHVPPLHKDWIELFDLHHRKYPPGAMTDIKLASRGIGQYLTNKNVGFTRNGKFNRTLAYDLRHAYAQRGHRLGVEPSIMSKVMGHDLETHIKQYHRWIQADAIKEAFERSLSRGIL
jgi:integrase